MFSTALDVLTKNLEGFFLLLSSRNQNVDNELKRTFSLKAVMYQEHLGMKTI